METRDKWQNRLAILVAGFTLNCICGAIYFLIEGFRLSPGEVGVNLLLIFCIIGLLAFGIPLGIAMLKGIIFSRAWGMAFLLSVISIYMFYDFALTIKESPRFRKCQADPYAGLGTVIEESPGVNVGTDPYAGLGTVIEEKETSWLGAFVSSNRVYLVLGVFLLVGLLIEILPYLHPLLPPPRAFFRGVGIFTIILAVLLPILSFYLSEVDEDFEMDALEKLYVSGISGDLLSEVARRLYMAKLLRESGTEIRDPFLLRPAVGERVVYVKHESYWVAPKRQWKGVAIAPAGEEPEQGRWEKRRVVTIRLKHVWLFSVVLAFLGVLGVVLTRRNKI